MIAPPSSKRAMDLTLASLALLGTLPVTGMIALHLHRTTDQPVLFCQLRPGLGGRPFELLKFRTMRDCEPGEDPIESITERVTPFGAFLRRTRLDELPSLWNVVRGELSLVGPRPLLMEYLERYTPHQTRRHEVMPGLTGWAQIHAHSIETWEEKFELDLWYVEHQSLWLDLKILATTVAQLLGRGGVWSGRRFKETEFRGSDAPDSRPPSAPAGRL